MLNAKRSFWLVFTIIAITSLIRNDVFNGTTNVVNWDGYGYYAYLPGAFVYGDIEEYAFAEEHFKNYDISGDIYQLMETKEGGRFPIYNIGLSVIWAPAFLVTHGIVLATGITPADGMSYPYQLMVVLMGLLFAFLGLLYLKQFLALYFSDLVVAITLLAVGLGTNLFYYIVEKPDMTHGYLFALFGLFLFRFALFASAQKTENTQHTELAQSGARASGIRMIWSVDRNLLVLGLIAGLMCLIRSSEIVIFAIPAFYGLRNWATLKRNFWRTLPIFTVALAVFSIQLMYYKAGTGSWWQDGYSGLGFDWLEPHLMDGLISYRRGWLVYTPVMLFALIGVFQLPKQWVLPVIIFLIGNVYLLFSWHIWWYGNTFGSRPVTQSYALLALPLAAFIAWVLASRLPSEMGAAAGAKKGKLATVDALQHAEGFPEVPTTWGVNSWRLVMVSATVLAFLLLNLFQHWQYNQRIIPLDFTNGTYYWHVFGKTTLDRKDRIYLDTDEKLSTEVYTSRELLLIDTLITVAPKAGREFTNLLEHKITAEEARRGTWLSTEISFSYYGETYDKWKFPSIVTEYRRGSDDLKWVQVKIPPTMDTPERDSLSFNLSLPDLQEGDIVKQYLWNLCQDSMVIRRYSFELLTVGRDPE
ncbi:MAG: hypothetical protein ACJAX1_001802 [Neolewinella sp.]|jgi:hypothetical protein